MRKTYEIYLSYFNDFLTLERCAEYHNITQSTMNRIYQVYSGDKRLKQMREEIDDASNLAFDRLIQMIELGKL